MATLFLQYPACSTCQKAKKWLTENNIEFTNRLIVEENPTVEELKAWIPSTGLQNRVSGVRASPPVQS